MKQTAVEKLEISLLGIISFDSEELRAKYKKAINQAKELEKQQIIDAYVDGNHSEMRGGKFIKSISEQYYNETFKNK